jgi:hypothetical protein
MKKLVLLFLLIPAFNYVSGQRQNCDSLFEKAKQIETTEGFEKCETQFLNILKVCPEYYDVHTELIKHYETLGTAVPIMALMWQNLLDYKSSNAKRNIKKIDFISHRYLVKTRKGTEIHVPPAYVRDWDEDYENNMSPLDAGFIAMGALDYSDELKNLNSADRMLQKFDKLFLHIDTMRTKHHGLYWDLYVDFFSSLYKTENFKTAMFLIMYRNEEREINTWVDNNSESVDKFYNWRQNYITKYIDSQR